MVAQLSRLCFAYRYYQLSERLYRLGLSYLVHQEQAVVPEHYRSTTAHGGDSPLVLGGY